MWKRTVPGKLFAVGYASAPFSVIAGAAGEVSAGEEKARRDDTFFGTAMRARDVRVVLTGRRTGTMDRQ